MESQVDSEGQPRGILGKAPGVVAYLLLVLTAILGLIEIYLIRQISIVLFTLLNPSPTPGALNLLNAGVVFAAGLVWILYVFGALEILSRKSKRRNPRNILIWALAIELLILILYFVIV